MSIYWIYEVCFELLGKRTTLLKWHLGWDPKFGKGNWVKRERKTVQREDIGKYPPHTLSHFSFQPQLPCFRKWYHPQLTVQVKPSSHPFFSSLAVLICSTSKTYPEPLLHFYITISQVPVIVHLYCKPSPLISLSHMAMQNKKCGFGSKQPFKAYTGWVLMFVSPQNSFVETLPSKVMI